MTMGRIFNVDASAWDLTDLEPAPGGMAVRRAMVSLGTPPSGYKFAFGGSYRPQFTDRVFHIIGLRGTTSASQRVTVHDEDFVAVFSHTFSGPALDFATVQFGANQQVVSSPAHPMLWSYLGTALDFAAAKERSPAFPDYSALTIPTGIAVIWQNRLVVAADDLLYFSGPNGQFRSFVALDFMDAPGGSVRGLHVDGGGNLACCTTQGTYLLPAEAAAYGIVTESGAPFQRVSSLPITEYGQTAVWRGVVFALTRHGIASVSGGDYRADLRQLRGPRVLADGVRHGIDGLRGARLTAHDELGLMVGHSSASCIVRPDMRFHSWWTVPNVVGCLEDQDGEVLLLTPSNVYRPEGSDESGVEGSMSGSVRTPLEGSPVLRHIHAGAACQGESMRAVVADQSIQTVAGPDHVTTAGTTEWGSGNYADLEIRSRRSHHSHRGDEHPVEVGFSGAWRDVSTSVSAEVAGISPRRPTN